MKAQQRLRRLTQKLKMTDRYIEKNKKFGDIETQRYKFDLQTKAINATMEAGGEQMPLRTTNERRAKT